MANTIAEGKASAHKTFEHIFNNVPQDALVRNRGMEIDVEGGQVILQAPGGLERAPMSNFALGQLCSKVGVPLAYTKELLANESPVVRDLARTNLQTLLQHAEEERYLVRSCQGQVRGVLSDAFKRIDARPLAESFAVAADQTGLVPIQGMATETKVAVKALLPIVFEPAPNEVICFGLHWETSDYGAGAHNVLVFMLRLWCTNFAISERALRQIHIGKKLDDVSFSAKTHLLESQTTASALSDIVKGALAPERVQAYCEVITRASEQSVDVNKQLDGLVKNGSLLKAERKAIGEKFVSADVEMLPPGNTTWRLSNAISWFAHAGGAEADRRMELERIAGAVLPVAVKTAA
jgi:hypothetical protein